MSVRDGIRSQSSARGAFMLADAIFVVVSAAAAAWAIAEAHHRVQAFAGAALVGMAAAMMLTTAFALLAAPVLGSIETMVPAMVAGMTSGTVICASMWMTALDTAAASAGGAVVGLVLAGAVQRYAKRCRSPEHWKKCTQRCV